MDRNKIIIIVILALIVAAYIVFVVYGSVNHEKENKNQRRSTAKNYDPDPKMKGFGSIMGNWFGRFLPKAEISNCPSPPAPKSEILCGNLSNAELNIPAAGSTFRVIKVSLTSGRNNPADIEYLDIKDSTTADKDKLFPDGQKFKLPDPDNLDNENKPSIEENIIVLGKGGKLKISCPANSNCKVEIK